MSKHHRFYRPELDVLRALAFCLVFFHHTTGMLPPWLKILRGAGAFGVCLFFLLSAFLITELLEREVQSTGTIRLRAFYARRILRIWPLYFAILLIDFATVHWVAPGAFAASRLAAYLLLAGNWYVARRGFLWSLSMPLWSISVEEQFYVLCPTIRRYTSRQGLMVFGCAALVVAYVALYVLCRQHANVDTYVWVNSFVQFQFFASGVLLALLLKGRVPVQALWLRVLLILGGLGAFYTAQAAFQAKLSNLPAQWSNLLPGYLLVNAGSIALLLGFLGASSLERAKRLVYLGKISYGLYAFHFAMLRTSDLMVLTLTYFTHSLRRYTTGLADVVAFLATVVVASISYRYFEKPILRFKQRFEVIRTRPA